jgi:hypothetical protein
VEEWIARLDDGEEGPIRAFERENRGETALLDEVRRRFSALR